MLKQITWHEYWTIVITLTAIYELFVVAIFYRKDLLMLAKGKSNVRVIGASDGEAASNHSQKHQRPHLFTVSATDTNEEAETHEINLTPMAHELADEIEVLLNEAGEKEFGKPEILFGLKQIIKSFRSLVNTSYRDDINNLIAQQCETNCSVALSEEEVQTLWLD
jgi:hypothetical protein